MAGPGTPTVVRDTAIGRGTEIAQAGPIGAVRFAATQVAGSTATLEAASVATSEVVSMAAAASTAEVAAESMAVAAFTVEAGTAKL